MKTSEDFYRLRQTIGHDPIYNALGGTPNLVTGGTKFVILDAYILDPFGKNKLILELKCEKADASKYNKLKLEFKLANKREMWSLSRRDLILNFLDSTFYFNN